MKILVSIETGRRIAVGEVVQDITAPGLAWVKVKAVNSIEGLVQLSGLKPIPWQAWHAPADIGAYFRGPKENSLAGGRCSSTGLSGHARVVAMTPMPHTEGREVQEGSNMQQVPKVLDLTPLETIPSGWTDASDQHSLTVSGPELDAILAGLRLLAREVGAGNVKFSDDDLIGHVWTNSGDHDGLAPDALIALADRLNGG